MTLQSIDDAAPEEEGGPIARSGFNYQDEIAVSIFIDMLKCDDIEKIHCETHDDIVVVRLTDGGFTKSAEYVQVKANAPDKLWSIADLCARKRAKAGTSIFEISLARDAHTETSQFRIVTLRQVVSELKLLTLPRASPKRGPNSDEFKALHLQFDTRFPGFESKKGNGSHYWLTHCVWEERHSEEAVRKANLMSLIQLSIAEGQIVLPEPAEVLLDELRAWVKEAGSARWLTEKHKKIITRDVARAWWVQRRDELIAGAATPSGGKLTEKMREAGLPDDLINLAVEMRRDYSATVRTSRYMEPDEWRRLQGRVKSEVASLRARFVSGQLDLAPAEFHALCLDRMDVASTAPAGTAEEDSAVRKGCMYDIADRCLLRFTRPSR